MDYTPEGFGSAEKKKKKKKNALLKVFSWLFPVGDKKDSSADESEIEARVADYIKEERKKESRRAGRVEEKSEQDPKKLVEIKDTQKTHRYRDRLQLAAGETRNIIANMSGTLELKPEKVFSMKEEIVHDYELTTRRPFNESLAKYVRQESGVEDRPDAQDIEQKIGDEIRKAEMTAMYRAIINRDASFGIRGEIAVGGERRKIIINLDSQNPKDDVDSQNPKDDVGEKIKAMEEARIAEVKAMDLPQDQKDTLVAKVTQEFGIIKEVRDMRINRRGSETDVTRLVTETMDLTGPNGLEETNLESVLDPETLDTTERRRVNIATIKELKTSNITEIAAAVKDTPEKVYKATETKQRPIHTLLLEKMIDGFAERHNEARKFFDDGRGTHLFEKLTNELESGDDTAAAETSKVLIEKEKSLKSIVTRAITKESEQGEEPAILLDKDKVMHVPGGTAIIVDDASRFTRLTGISDNEAVREQYESAIKEKGVAGAYLKGKIADKIHEGGYAGDVIIIYANPNRTLNAETAGKMQNRWDAIVSDHDTKQLLLHEIDHLLQKRQLEGLSEGTNKAMEMWNDGQVSIDKINEIYKSLYENGLSSKYFFSIKDDALLKAVADKLVTPEQALEAYLDSMGIDPNSMDLENPAELQRKISVRRSGREALFEYSSILADGEFIPDNPNLSMLYLAPENGKIPEEHLRIYKFLLTANTALQKANEMIPSRSPEEMATLRREIIGLIQTGYHKGADYLTDNLMRILPDEYKPNLDDIKTEVEQSKTKVEVIYGSSEDFVPPANSDVDFSVFPVHRHRKDLLGTSDANSSVDMVDALSASIFGQPFAMARSAQLERQAKHFEGQGNTEMARYMRMRKPQNRGGEEISPDSTLLMKIAEVFPGLGAVMLPGKMEWGKAGLIYPGGHSLYGRTIKRIPIIGPILERHFPVLLEGNILGYEKAISPLAMDAGKLVSADKNIHSILTGLQVGFDSMGMDQQEMITVLGALPLFREVQMGQGLAPQIIPSLAGLEDDEKQVWFDRSTGTNKWSIDFRSEVIYGENESSAKLDSKIQDAQNALSALHGTEAWGKKALALKKKIKSLEKAKQETGTMERIYSLLEAQKGRPEGERYSMRNLVELARKSHEGMFWDQDPNKERPHYFKVGIETSPGQMEQFDLKDVNLFIKRYSRAYVKEIFESEVNPDTREPLMISDPMTRIARSNLALITDQLDTLKSQLPTATGGDKDEILKSILHLESQQKGLEKQVQEGSRKYSFINTGVEGYDKEKFFEIAWGEAESMISNHELGMEFYADFEFRVMQASLVERRTFLAATFYSRLDRILNHFGHWTVVAGLGLAVGLGSSFGVTLVLAGSAMLIADVLFISKQQQIWQARRIKALEVTEKLDNMLSLYEKAASGEMLSPDTLEMLARQKSRVEFMTEAIMKVDARETVKFPADRPFFAIGSAALALFDQYGEDIISGKI